jgi:drug/metabolite transporter (DMT)-like permease
MHPGRNSALIAVLSAVPLFGLAGVLGKMSDLPAMLIVLGRVAFGGMALACYLALRHIPIRIRRRPDLLALAVSGALLAIHWTAFFQAVRVSSVAIALLSYSTFPLFTALFEPLLLRVHPQRFEIGAACLILPGMYLIVPSLSLSDNVTRGAAWGMLSALTFAVLSVWNRGLTRRFPSAVIGFWQNVAALLVLLPALLVSHQSHPVTVGDLVVLLVLGVACTAFAHVLFIEGMRTLSAQTASVIAALEPVWGILFALLLLDEVPIPRVVLGGVLIVGAALVPILAGTPISPLQPPPSGGPPPVSALHADHT